MRALPLLVLAAVAVLPAVAHGAGPALDAPATATIGGTLEATGTGLKAGRYTLTLVADDAPARGARCIAQIGGRKRTHRGRVTFSAKVPGNLRCYQGASTPLGVLPASAGRYHLVLGAKVAPAGWSGSKTFLRRKLRLRG